jgi:hypothetical protein
MRGAAAASQTAVDKLRLAVECSEIFKPDLACNLNLLSDYLREIEGSGIENYESALEKSKEAVEIQHSLTSKDPKRYSANLVTYLDTLSQNHNKLKQHQEALNVAIEAFGIYSSHSLAEDATLALLLHHQSLYCAELRRFNHARKKSKESIAIQRNLCNVNSANAKHRSVLVAMEKHLSAIKYRDGAYEAMNAWSNRGLPPDVTRTDIRRAALGFTFVCMSGMSFFWGALSFGPIVGAAMAVGLVGGSHILSWFNVREV